MISEVSSRNQFCSPILIHPLFSSEECHKILWRERENLLSQPDLSLIIHHRGDDIISHSHLFPCVICILFENLISKISNLNFNKKGTLTSHHQHHRQKFMLTETLCFLTVCSESITFKIVKTLFSYKLSEHDSKMYLSP